MVFVLFISYKSQFKHYSSAKTKKKLKKLSTLKRIFVIIRIFFLAQNKLQNTGKKKFLESEKNMVKRIVNEGIFGRKSWN